MKVNERGEQRRYPNAMFVTIAAFSSADDCIAVKMHKQYQRCSDVQRDS